MARLYIASDVTAPQGDSNAVPFQVIPGFHRRTLSGQGAASP
jgi:hypothetical protein